jgi:hypothetical protein
MPPKSEIEGQIKGARDLMPLMPRAFEFDAS